MKSLVPPPPEESDLRGFGGAPAPVVLQSEPIAPYQEPAHPPVSGDLVTCPECGEMSLVETAQRRSTDFCRRCDFPLFWARTTVIVPSGEETGASLRRLPGTVGRAATAAVPCPHCGEPNTPTAQTCIRCGLSMTVTMAPPPPPPEPVYIVPVPEPEPEPERSGIPWWWILAMVACVIAIGLLLWVALS